MEISVSTNHRFLLVALLAWIPLIFFGFGLTSAFRGIHSAKATGIAAVAGGVGQAFTLFGFLCFLIAQIVAIVFLFRSFAQGSALRNAFAGLSIAACSLALLLVAAATATAVLIFVRHSHP